MKPTWHQRRPRSSKLWPGSGWSTTNINEISIEGLLGNKHYGIIIADKHWGRSLAKALQISKCTQEKDSDQGSMHQGSLIWCCSVAVAWLHTFSMAKILFQHRIFRVFKGGHGPSWPNTVAMGWNKQPGLNRCMKATPPKIRRMMISLVMALVPISLGPLGYFWKGSCTRKKIDTSFVDYLHDMNVQAWLSKLSTFTVAVAQIFYICWPQRCSGQDMSGSPVFKIP